MDTKTCPKCGETKPLTAFAKNRARSDGHSGYCRACQNIATSVNYQRLRSEAMEALGGPRCSRCGFDDLRALVIDHIDGAGGRHREDAGSGYSVLKHVLRYPEQYQVLCANCNQIKRHEEGEWASHDYMAKARAIEREKVTSPPRWARDFDACASCETTDVPHKSQGLCRNCYMRLRRRGTTDKIEDLSAHRSEAMKRRWADPEERARIKP